MKLLERVKAKLSGIPQQIQSAATGVRDFVSQGYQNRPIAPQNYQGSNLQRNIQGTTSALDGFNQRVGRTIDYARQNPGEFNIFDDMGTKAVESGRALGLNKAAYGVGGAADLVSQILSPRRTLQGYSPKYLEEGITPEQDTARRVGRTLYGIAATAPIAGGLPGIGKNIIAGTVLGGAFGAGGDIVEGKMPTMESIKQGAGQGAENSWMFPVVNRGTSAVLGAGGKYIPFLSKLTDQSLGAASTTLANRVGKESIKNLLKPSAQHIGKNIVRETLETPGESLVFALQEAASGNEAPLSEIMSDRILGDFVGNIMFGAGRGTLQVGAPHFKNQINNAWKSYKAKPEVKAEIEAKKADIDQQAKSEVETILEKRDQYKEAVGRKDYFLRPEKDPVSPEYSAKNTEKLDYLPEYVKELSKQADDLERTIKNYDLLSKTQNLPPIKNLKKGLAETKSELRQVQKQIKQITNVKPPKAEATMIAVEDGTIIPLKRPLQSTDEITQILQKTRDIKPGGTQQPSSGKPLLLGPGGPKESYDLPQQKTEVDQILQSDKPKTTVDDLLKQKGKELGQIKAAIKKNEYPDLLDELKANERVLKQEYASLAQAKKDGVDITDNTIKVGGETFAVPAKETLKNLKTGAVSSLTDTPRSFATTLDNKNTTQIGKGGTGHFMKLWNRVSSRGNQAQKVRNDGIEATKSAIRSNGLSGSRKDFSIIHYLHDPETYKKVFGAVPEGITPAHRKAAVEIRSAMDAAREIANQARVARGEKPIGFLEQYSPLISKSKKSGEFTATNFDSFFTKKRGEDLKGAYEDNYFKALNQYFQGAGHEAFGKTNINELKANAKWLKKNGLIEEANFIENNWINKNILGQEAGVDKFVSNLMGKHADNFEKLLEKVIGARATFALKANPYFYGVTQPASIVGVVSELGWRNTGEGIFKWFTDPKMRADAMSDPGYVAKSGSGSVGKTGGGIVDDFAFNADSMKKGLRGTVNDFADSISRRVELNMQGIAATSARVAGKKKGLTGKDLDLFADYVAQDTQAAYIRAERSGLQSSKIFRALVPFQTFSIDMWNRTRRWRGAGGGIPLEASERMAQATNFIIAGSIYNLYSRWATGRDLNTVGSAIPVVGGAVDEILMRGRNTLREESDTFAGIEQPLEGVGLLREKRPFAGTFDSQGLNLSSSPVSVVNDGSNWAQAVIAAGNGNNRPLRQLAVQWSTGLANVGGAKLINQLWDAYELGTKKEYTTRGGNVGFVPQKGDVARTAVSGLWSSKSGREYLRGDIKPLTGKESDIFRASGSDRQKFDELQTTKRQTEGQKSEQGFFDRMFGREPKFNFDTVPDTKEGKKAYISNVNKALEMGVDVPEKALKTALFNDYTAQTTSIKEKKIVFESLHKYMKDEFLSDEQKASILKASGSTQEQYDFYEMSKLPQDARIQELLPTLGDLSEPENFQKLALLRASVAGNQVLGNNMISYLYENDFISKAQKDELTALQYNEIDDKFFFKKDSKFGKGGSGSGKSAKSIEADYRKYLSIFNITRANKQKPFNVMSFFKGSQDPRLISSILSKRVG
jgi:hypothetical protein